jgi:hypothetical protein
MNQDRANRNGRSIFDNIARCGRDAPRLRVAGRSRETMAILGIRSAHASPGRGAAGLVREDGRAISSTSAATAHRKARMRDPAVRMSTAPERRCPGLRRGIGIIRSHHADHIMPIASCRSQHAIASSARGGGDDDQNVTLQLLM